jgi:hypothetical protein
VIFHTFLLEELLAAGLQVDGIYFMQKFVDPAALVGNRPANAEEWGWIMGPTGKDVPITDRTNSTYHGNFSSDGDTQIAIQARIARRMG